MSVKWNFRRLYGCIVVLALVRFGLAATCFYVDPESGAITNDGSAASPWSSFEDVIDSGKIGAPVLGGDTLLLRTGNHGRVTISNKKNAGVITIMAQPGQHPVLERIRFVSCRNWILKAVTVTSRKDSPTDRASLAAIDGGDGTRCNVTIENCSLYTVMDASSWTMQQWNDIPLNGISIGSVGSIVRGNYIKNVNFGISGDGDSSLVQGNTVENFAGDGLRGLGNDMVFEYNTVKNCYDVNDNHDDGFQSWSLGDGGVGTGTVYRLTLRGNTIINYEDAAQPFRGTLQGIGCFDGMFEGWIVENNLIMVDHWHGISLYGAKNCRIINNTVCDLNSASPGPPWIKITAHKNGTPASGCIVRNNLTTKLSIDANSNTTEDHNLIITDPNEFFVDYLSGDLQLKAGCAAIDSGSAEGAPATDIRNAIRPAGNGYDIGAYEYGATGIRPPAAHATAAARIRISASSGSVPIAVSGLPEPTLAVRILSSSGSMLATADLVPAGARWDRQTCQGRPAAPGLFLLAIETDKGLLVHPFILP